MPGTTACAPSPEPRPHDPISVKPVPGHTVSTRLTIGTLSAIGALHVAWGRRSGFSFATRI